MENTSLTLLERAWTVRRGANGPTILPIDSLPASTRLRQPALEAL